ncbi:MAG TPA: GNAT family N-acetyltransferase, partial [Gemmatimonadales bacterium]|nr:GNAT family N-acetyltransferase [Gemmatimonadales bacterium]
VLIGAKRPSGTLVHKIAVHPDHRRQGHGRHLLDSLGSKLAILGPPRIVAEVPDTLAPACGLFDECGYVREALLTDYVLGRDENDPAVAQRCRPALTLRHAQGHPERSRGMSERGNAARVEGFVIPVTVDDLAANGLLGQDYPQTCWERSVETLTARKDDIAGLAVASDERIEASILYIRAGARIEILFLRSFIDDEGARLALLLARLGAGGVRFQKVHPAEISSEWLERLYFRPAGGHRLYAARARSG